MVNVTFTSCYFCIKIVTAVRGLRLPENIIKVMVITAWCSTLKMTLKAAQHLLPFPVNRLSILNRDIIPCIIYSNAYLIILLTSAK